MKRSMLGLPLHHQLPEFTKIMPIELVMPSNHLILCWPRLFLPPILPSISVFSNESALGTRCLKYWSFSFSMSPSNEHPGLISFTMDWLDLLAVQGTLKSLLQHHGSKESIFRCSAFFIVQITHPYITTGKAIALTGQTLLTKYCLCFLICCLSGVAAERSNPTSKEQQLHWCRKAKRSYSMFKVRRGGREEIPLIQGKRQWLLFARTAMKRCPMSKVRETQGRR